MAALVFPPDPVRGDVVGRWRWDGGTWVMIGGVSGGGASVPIGPQPSGAMPGDLWWDGRRLLIFSDTQWLTVNAAGVTDASNAQSGDVGEYVFGFNAGGSGAGFHSTEGPFLFLGAGDWSVSTWYMFLGGDHEEQTALAPGTFTITLTVLKPDSSGPPDGFALHVPAESGWPSNQREWTFPYPGDDTEDPAAPLEDFARSTFIMPTTRLSVGEPFLANIKGFLRAGPAFGAEPQNAFRRGMWFGDARRMR